MVRNKDELVRSERIVWIDTMKAICIFSVVMNHSPFPQSMFRVDFYFLVGFFFVSGYVFKNYSVKKRVAKILDSIAIPYLLLTPIAFVLSKTNLHNLYFFPVQTISRFIVDLLLGIKYWFLPCLMSMEFLYTFLFKLKIRYVDFIILGITTILFLLGFVNNSHLPWHIDTAVYGLIFFVLGHICKEIDLNLLSARIGALGAVLVIAYIILSTFLFPLFPFNTSLNMFSNNFVLLTMNLLGLICLILISLCIKPNRLINYLGKNSLTIYVLQVCFLGIIHKMFFSWADDTIFYNSFTGIVFSLVLVLAMYPLISLMKKYTAILCGKSKIFQEIFKV